MIWKRYVTIPYDRIQNVDIYRGVLARLLGLSDLNIQTAGTTSGSVLGLLRRAFARSLAHRGRTAHDELVLRARNSKHQGLKPNPPSITSVHDRRVFDPSIHALAWWTGRNRTRSFRCQTRRGYHCPHRPMLLGEEKKNLFVGRFSLTPETSGGLVWLMYVTTTVFVLSICG